MRLTFDLKELRDLLATAEIHWQKLGTSPLYEQETGPGFWLVGDNGVYLMSNHKRLIANEKPDVVFAVECNPYRQPPDIVDDMKRATFGGDDGIEFLGADTIRNWLSGGGDKVWVAFGRDGELALLSMQPDTVEH